MVRHILLSVSKYVYYELDTNLNIFLAQFCRLLDLQRSCDTNDDGELTNCQCNDAERRIDNGQLQCGIDLCPEDCFVCIYCLYYVVDCHSPDPSVSPSAMPTKVVSAMPSILPTVLSSASPSFVPSGSPSSLVSSFPTYISASPTELNSISPSASPTITFVKSPSSLPSLSASLSPSLAPFEINDCNSYRNLW